MSDLVERYQDRVKDTPELPHRLPASLRMKIDGVEETSRDGWDCREWSVTLRWQGRSTSIKYRTGMGITEVPTKHDVVFAMLSDVRMLENAPTAGDVARELGMDDTNEAVRLHRELQSMRRKVQHLTGESYPLFDEWLDSAGLS